MTVDRWKRVQTLFAAALDLPAEARSAYLRDNAEDAGLRAEVASLLEAHATRGRLDRVADRLAAPNGTVSGHPTVLPERFRIVRRLGSGGMGVVYEAVDRNRDETVALKTLRSWDPAGIYRLKKEFRSLAEVAHRNLVTLYELIAHEQSWFYTMELIEGVTFLDYTRGGGASDLAQLRAAFPQIVEGVMAIHEAGKLHRDLKPSNVLVTPAGRVVILDFGIAAELATSTGALQSVEEGVVGTVAYMAPEQVRGSALPASDWYALGVMLYEALTGRLPYTGTAWAIMVDKVARDPPSPNDVMPGLPSDLVSLCVDLLVRDPERRAGAEDVLGRLGASRSPPPPRSTPRLTRVGAPVFLGREAPLAELENAFLASRDGAPVSVYVHGTSGIGKSTLVQTFLDGLNRGARAVVLAGRCYARESVPYKAVDGIVDRLSQYLRSPGAADAGRLLPPDTLALERLFPVLGRVDAIAQMVRPDHDITSPLELRRCAFEALRDILRRICARQPLVVWVDDLQWADPDSVLLLETLLGPPGPPPMLFVATLRTEEIEAQPLLRSMLQRARSSRTREIQLGPLSPDQARQIVLEQVGQALSAAQGTVEAIVREAGGSPLLVEQLARYAATAPAQEGVAGVTLARALSARMARLPPEARVLLETLAVAGQPVSPVVARDAAGIAGDERPLLALLAAERLVRTTTTMDRLDLYHDRIRETLAAAIPPGQVAETHLRLARATERHGIDDPEALLEHYRAAGHPERAATHAARGAERAARALAFEQAARLYRAALELCDTTPDLDPVRLRIGLADALANSGRGAEAADAYLQAAERSAPGVGLDLRRQAAEQLMRCGHIDRGLAVMREVLSAVGLKLARSPKHALLRLVWRRAQLRLRGLRFSEREESRVAADVLRRIDMCWAVAIGLARVDFIRAADFQSLNLLLSLRAGEPYRVARALAMEAALVALPGGSALQRAAGLVATTRALAERVRRPHALALGRLAEAYTSFSFGRLATARTEFEAAARTFRAECTGVVWEINTAESYAMTCLWLLGEWSELVRRVPARLREARALGDLYAATGFASGLANAAWLIAGDVAGARDALREAMSRWTLPGFHVQDYGILNAGCQSDLYAGEAAAAWTRINRLWPDLARSMLLRIQGVRVEALHLRARSALAAASEPRLRKACLYRAERDARRIARERIPYAQAWAELVVGGVAALQGDEETAVRSAARGITACEAAGLAGYAAAIRRCYGRLIRGDQGAALVQAADAWFLAQGVAEPERMTRMLAPGFPSCLDHGLA